MGKLAFNRLLNIQKCLLEIADLRMRTIAEQTLYTCGCGANEFNFRCGFALCGAKKIFATPSTGLNVHNEKNFYIWVSVFLRVTSQVGLFQAFLAHFIWP